MAREWWNAMLNLFMGPARRWRDPDTAAEHQQRLQETQEKAPHVDRQISEQELTLRSLERQLELERLTRRPQQPQRQERSNGGGNGGGLQQSPRQQ